MDRGNRPDSGQGTNRVHKNKAKYRAQSHGKPVARKQAIISRSGIHSGDVGIFVTCDKGQEKKCLQEVSDLLSEYFEDAPPPGLEGSEGLQEEGGDENSDIEADILAELDSLRPHPSSTARSSRLPTFITLDIPCVSFARFPSASSSNPTHDPVEIVRKLCVSASLKDSPGPRSRYIKRLTPISLIQKVLNDGLESLCDKVLPAHFSSNSTTSDENKPPSAEPEQTAPRGLKFAIRPTIRNNNKLDRDQVIRLVADKVEKLGEGKHTVDLKGYDKLVLVDVYRNVVGMSVVGNEFETLKRFNLAEIQAAHFNEVEQDDAVEEVRS